MTVAALNYTSSGYKNFGVPYLDLANGVSQEAKSINAKIVNINSARPQSVTSDLDVRLSSQAFEALLEILEEGENISPEVFLEALAFIKKLPASFELPDLAQEPSGAIAFEWYKNPYEVFVISINGTRTLEFAALQGRGNELHGKMNYSGEIPIQLKELLEIFFTV